MSENSPQNSFKKFSCVFLFSLEISILKGEKAYKMKYFTQISFATMLTMLKTYHYKNINCFHLSTFFIGQEQGRLE